jgi:hypothetical protein
LISLNDEELRAIMAIAGPLCPKSRDIFLRAIAQELSTYPPDQRGPGMAHRIGLTLQRQFLGPAPRDAA